MGTEMAVGAHATTDERTGLSTRAEQEHGRERAAFDTHRTAPVKVYTDVSLAGGETGVGYVVKNHNGRILYRNWCLLDGDHTPSEAEAHAIRKAMFDVGADHAKFYTDCEEVATVLRADVSLPVRKFEYFTLECVDREENFGAHLLARKANPHVEV